MGMGVREWVCSTNWASICPAAAGLICFLSFSTIVATVSVFYPSVYHRGNSICFLSISTIVATSNSICFLENRYCCYDGREG